MRSRRLLSGVVASVLLLSGCSDSTEKGAGDGPAASTLTSGLVNIASTKAAAKSGVVVTLADYSEVRSLDPVITASTGESGGTALAAIYETLVYYDVDAETYEPWLAESIESNDDATEWTLGLRSGVRFSNGDALDASAVKRSIQRYLDNSGPDAGLIKDSLIAMEVTSQTGLVFNFRRPWATFPAMLAQGAGMVVAPGTGVAEEFKPVGAGPFVLDEYRPSESLTLAANTDYWGGEVAISGLRFVWPNGDKARFDTVRGSEADVTMLRSPDVIREALSKEWGGYLAVVNGGRVLLLNNREGRAGSDLEVRRAVWAAIDPEVINDRVWAGGALSGKELFGSSSRWHAHQNQRAPGAGEQMDQAKIKDLGPLTYVSSNDPAGRAEAVTIQAALEGAGFDVEIEWLNSPTDIYQRVYLDHNFDLAPAAVSVTEEDPFHRLTNFLSSSSTRNVVGYTNPEADKILQRLQGADGDAQVSAVLGELETLWEETVPAVPTAALPVFVTWDQKIQGVVPTAERMLLLGKAWVADE